MLDWQLAVESVAIEPHAVGPTLVFSLRVEPRPDVPVHAIALRTKILIDARRRRYSTEEQQRLTELFGAPEEWARTLRALPWVDVSTTVPAFEGATTVSLWVPCTYDMEVASTKYLHGIDDAGVPLQFLFSGTAFTSGANGRGGLVVEPLSRDLDATWRMPATTWRDLMAVYFPDGQWLRLRPDRFDALVRYKADNALPTWDATVDSLLEASRAGADLLA